MLTVETTAALSASFAGAMDHLAVLLPAIGVDPLTAPSSVLDAEHAVMAAQTAAEDDPAIAGLLDEATPTLLEVSSLTRTLIREADDADEVVTFLMSMTSQLRPTLSPAAAAILDAQPFSEAGIAEFRAHFPMMKAMIAAEGRFA